MNNPIHRRVLLAVIVAGVLFSGTQSGLAAIIANCELGEAAECGLSGEATAIPTRAPWDEDPPDHLRESHGNCHAERPANTGLSGSISGALSGLLTRAFSPEDLQLTEEVLAARHVDLPAPPRSGVFRPPEV